MAPTQLEIKTKALGRLVKEEGLYQRELEDQEKVIEGLKAQNADSYEIKKQIEVLDDTKKVIPEIRKKIRESKESLEAFLESYTDGDDTSAAKQNIQAATKVI